MTENRVPAGVPTGGQFATSAKNPAEVTLDSEGVAQAVPGVDSYTSCPVTSGAPCHLHPNGAGPHSGDLEIRACTDDGETTESNVPEDSAHFWSLYSSDTDGTWLAIEDYDSREEARDVLAVSSPLTLKSARSSYLDTLRWSAGVIDENGERVDVDDLHFSADAELAAGEDVDSFLTENASLIAKARQIRPTYSIDAAMTDFAFTRNGHGAGFWDSGLGDVGDELTKAAKAYGSAQVYRGDDGDLHVT